MSELINQSPDLYPANIVRPQGPQVKVSSDVDYIFIFRKDIDFTISPLAKRFATDNRINCMDIDSIMKEEYDVFFAKFLDIIQWGHTPNGRFEIHLYDPHELEDRVKAKAVSMDIVSLDPLIDHGVHELELSREYYFSGRNFVKRIARPDSSPLSNQAHQIADQLSGNPVALIDDDIFKGGSIITALDILHDEGVDISKVIPGIKVGNTPQLSDRGISLDPVIEYTADGDQPILKKVNIADARDYLMGGGGLVVRLPDGGYGRAPYFLPFLPTSDKTGIPEGFNRTFALHILKANQEFFNRVSEKVGKSLLLRHMDPHFSRLMHEVFGFDINTPMQHVVGWAMNDIDKIWEFTKGIGVVEELQDLAMSDNLIFIDVNDTLLQESDTGGRIDEQTAKEVRKVAIDLKSQGFEIGLASDSTIDKLALISEQLGINGPLLAENGNIVTYGGKKTVVRGLENATKIKEDIRNLLMANSFNEVEDQKPIQFGGDHAKYSDNEWAFGANRQTSISLYAPAGAIESIQNLLKDIPNISFDVDLKNNFLAIHPGDFRKNKMKTAAMIKNITHRVVMIGNSLSDWINPSFGIECGFVGNAMIEESVKEQSAYLSKKRFGNGVVDILRKIYEGIPGHMDVFMPFIDGEVNRTLLVEYQNTQAVLQFANQYSNEALGHLSPYFHPDKLRKIEMLTNILTQYGIPIPKIILSGQGNPIPWILTEQVPGENLNNYFPQLTSEQKLKVVKKMAAQLSRIHMIPSTAFKSMPSISNVEENHQQLVDDTLQALQDEGVLSLENCIAIDEWYKKYASILPQFQKGLVHRDYFQRNIFVDPLSLEVTGIIDWGDTAHVGDVIKDTILAAKWIADDISTKEGMNMFITFLETYNDRSPIKIDLNKALSYLAVYTVEWCLETALFTHYMGNQTQVYKQIDRIKSIIET